MPDRPGRHVVVNEPLTAHTGPRSPAFEQRFGWRSPASSSIQAGTEGFPRAALSRASLEMAVDAPPGALFALSERVLADLVALPEGLPVIAEVRRQLRRAVDAAMP